MWHQYDYKECACQPAFEASFDIHAQITLHADHTGTLALNGSQHYMVNLTTTADAGT